MPSRRRNAVVAGVSLAASLAAAQSFGNYSSISNVSTSDCPTDGGAHIIVARASVEPLGYGIIGFVKDVILKASNASNAEYVIYPATLTDYFVSESDGVLAMKDLVQAYIAKDCPNNAPLVLMGYSQGAQVVSDYVSGQSVTNFPYNSSTVEPAPESVLSRIAAIITMGDPSINITDNSYHVGNSTKPGLFARLANASEVFTTSGLAARTQSYCDALDPYCASAGNFDNLSVHLQYVQEYGRQAEEFVLQKIQQYYANQTSGTGNGSNATMLGAPAPSSLAESGAAGVGSPYVGSTVAMGLVMGAMLLFAL